jgi:hypothetical protein
MGRPKYTAEKKISRHTLVNPSGCWIWKGKIAKNKYGHVFYNGKCQLAHRFLFEMFMFIIPDIAARTAKYNKRENSNS